MRKLFAFLSCFVLKGLYHGHLHPWAWKAGGIWANSCIVSGVHPYFCFVCVILSGKVVGSLPFLH